MVGARHGRAGAKRTVFMDHDNIVGYDDTYVQNPLKHPMEQLSEVIAERGWASGAHRRRDGQLLVHGRGPRALRSDIEEPPSRTPPGW